MNRMTGAPVAIVLLLMVANSAWAADAVSIEAALRAQEGKSVTLTLDGGAEISGRVAGLSSVTVHITELKGKEFFDAVVRLEDISAVTFRAKDK